MEQTRFFDDLAVKTALSGSTPYWGAMGVVTLLGYPDPEETLYRVAQDGQFQARQANASGNDLVTRYVNEAVLLELLEKAPRLEARRWMHWGRGNPPEFADGKVNERLNFLVKASDIMGPGGALAHLCHWYLGHLRSQALSPDHLPEALHGAARKTHKLLQDAAAALAPLTKLLKDLCWCSRPEDHTLAGAVPWGALKPVKEHFPLRIPYVIAGWAEAAGLFGRGALGTVEHLFLAHFGRRAGIDVFAAAEAEGLAPIMWIDRHKRGHEVLAAVKELGYAMALEILAAAKPKPKPKAE